MYLIRQAAVEDLPTLLKLAKMVYSNNLVPDADILRTKILCSRDSFAGKTPKPLGREFMFVLEDSDTGNVIGTSSIISRISSPGRPHLYLLVRKREHFSTDLATGQVHVTLQLTSDETGPTEIGGLVLTPAYRGHRARLGSLLSLVRFHFMGLHHDWFSPRVIAEMMPPLTPDSRNTLWEYLGRRFINLEYSEADRFSRQSKEFITSLYPTGEIYASLLPAEARNLIGKINDEAAPAKAMLESLGFRYVNHCDPFDGGPYLEAAFGEIPLVTATSTAKLTHENGGKSSDGFVSFVSEGGFRAVRAKYTVHAEGNVSLEKEITDALGATVGATVGITPRTTSQQRLNPAPVQQAAS